jgi:hypothetical protein
MDIRRETRSRARMLAVLYPAAYISALVVATIVNGWHETFVNRGGVLAIFGAIIAAITSFLVWAGWGRPE